MIVLCDVKAVCVECGAEVEVFAGEFVPDECPDCGAHELEVVDDSEPCQDGWGSEDGDWDW